MFQEIDALVLRASRTCSTDVFFGKDRKQMPARVLMQCSRRVTTGHNGDDGRGNFAGFLSRHQRICTR